jgi:hypothetical protein
MTLWVESPEPAPIQLIVENFIGPTAAGTKMRLP